MFQQLDKKVESLSSTSSGLTLLKLKFEIQLNPENFKSSRFSIIHFVRHSVRNAMSKCDFLFAAGIFKLVYVHAIHMFIGHASKVMNK